MHVCINLDLLSSVTGYFSKVDVHIKIRDSKMFNFFNSFVNILMLFKKVLFNDFHLMLLSSLVYSPKSFLLNYRF